jgi:hypothetical protein
VINCSIFEPDSEESDEKEDEGVILFIESRRRACDDIWPENSLPTEPPKFLELFIYLCSDLYKPATPEVDVDAKDV